VTAPIALTVHPGGGIPPEWRRQLIVDWLAENSIDPKRVSADHPVIVVDLAKASPETPGDALWSRQVIVFTEYHRLDGITQADPTTGRPVTFQSTVPLKTPFPAEPTTDDEGRSDGEADSEEAEQAPEVLVRDQEQAGLPDRHEGEGRERPRQGQDARDESTAKGSSSRGNQAVPQPEEDRRTQEEVGGA
jgi:hypothetical protein